MAHRLQVTLTDRQYEELRSEAASSGVSIAELVRRSVDGSYRRLTPAEKADAFRAAAGVWANRTDIPEDSMEYVRQLRGPGLGERLRRLGLD